MGALVVIGNFDGVHRGHAAMLSGARDEARALGLELVLLTFFPHPAAVLGRRAPSLLTRQARKRELVHEVAPELRFHEQRFDLAYAAQSPEVFARRLAEELGATHVVVGRNFRFGKDRAGDFDGLVKLGQHYGFVARSEPLAGDERGPWSSTRARAALASGDLDDAHAVLGRPHMTSGVVVAGKRLGRTIGFPTANLGDVLEAPPAIGVYATRVERVRDGVVEPLGAAAVSVGTNPTTDADGRLKIEAFILDFDGDIYGAELRVHFVERLRGEERFADLDALKAKIAEDVERTRARVC
ncbi:MAG: riboflavin biosynthesis protein RibF [Polyangiaceae bacterium]